MTENSRKMSLITVIIFASLGKDACAEAVEKCLEKIVLSKHKIVITTLDTNTKFVGGKYTNLIVVSGQGAPRWKDGMSQVCGCLEASGFCVQAINSAQSFIPTGFLT